MRFNPNQSMLAGIPTATLQNWLKEAQWAYRDYMLGRRPIAVSYEGKATSFKPSTPEELQNWISLLQMQLGIIGGRRALRPIFR